MKAERLARGYIELAHALEHYQPGSIDAYFGPEDWKPAAVPPISELAETAEALLEEAEGLEPFDRREFMMAQLRALQTSFRLLQGEKLGLLEEVAGLYDLTPQRVPERRFEAALERLDALLPGGSDLREREQAFRRRFEVPLERLERVIEPLLSEFRTRTARRFGLPEGESFEVRLVAGEPWGAYNWYLGGYRSRIDLNTDLPVYLYRLPALLAHEAYPGHHTEHAHKEALLYREWDRAEHSVQLINAPECVLSEGIAVWAGRMILAEDERADWLLDLAKPAGLELSREEVEALLELQEAGRALRHISANAALLLHQDGAKESEVLAYLERYDLATPEEAQKTLQFLTHPNFRSYSFTYTEGESLLRPLLKGSEGEAWFKRLLQEPLTPSALRRAAA